MKKLVSGLKKLHKKYKLTNIIAPDWIVEPYGELEILHPFKKKAYIKELNDKIVNETLLDLENQIIELSNYIIETNNKTTYCKDCQNKINNNTLWIILDCYVQIADDWSESNMIIARLSCSHCWSMGISRAWDIWDILRNNLTSFR